MQPACKSYYFVAKGLLGQRVLESPSPPWAKQRFLEAPLNYTLANVFHRLAATKARTAAGKAVVAARGVPWMGDIALC